LFIQKVKRQNLFLLLIAVIVTQNLQAQYKNIIIDYFGQQLPGEKAEIFSPDFICLPGTFIQNCCFSVDGKEFIFVITNKDWSSSTIMYTKYENEKWTNPVPLPCSGNIGSVPYFSYDGKEIYYILYKYNNTVSADIYVSRRTLNGWSDPERLNEPVNSDQDEWEVCISENDVLYFSSDRPGGFGKMDIYTSKKTGEKFSNLQNTGEPVNTGSLDECPYIAPDESFMVFNDWKPNPKFQGNNLYITYKKEDGSWTNPKDLGSSINSDLLDIYPYITPDGKYLIFTRRDGAFSAASSKLYWTSTEFIDSLRHTNFEPYWKYNIPNMTAQLEVPFNYQVPDSVYFDDDEDDILTLAAENLPGWMTFDPVTREFHGVPHSKSDSGNITVRVADLAKSSSAASFSVIVRDTFDPKKDGSYFKQIEPDFKKD
jgi:hypothetical protein